MIQRFIVSALSVFVLSMLSSAPALAADDGAADVLVFGGTGRTGVSIVKGLREAGAAVTVFVRPTSNRETLSGIGVTFTVGDALLADDVAAAFEERSYSAVISAIGRRRGETRPDYTANANIISAAEKAGVSRMLMLSSMGAGNSREHMPEVADFMLEVLDTKTAAEDELIASSLDYTIIRPGGLRDGKATGNAKLTEDVTMVGHPINRSDLGALTVDAWADEASANKIYHAFDPSLSYPD